MSKLEPELEKYYDDYLNLFMTDGWKEFIKDTENVKKSINFLSLEDAKQLHLAQGQTEILNWILNWEESVKNSFESLQLEDSINEHQDNFE